MRRFISLSENAAALDRLKTNTFTLPKGHALHHGTGLSPEDWAPEDDHIAGPAWFGDEDLAGDFAHGMLLTYRTTRPLELLIIDDAVADTINQWIDDGGPNEAAEKVIALGFDGWLMDDEIMVGDTSTLEFVSIHQEVDEVMSIPDFQIEDWIMDLRLKHWEKMAKDASFLFSIGPYRVLEENNDIFVMLGDKCVGKMNVFYEGKLQHVKMIQIIPEHRRKNIAARLYAYLLSRGPVVSDYDQTPMGQAIWRWLVKTYDVRSYVDDEIGDPITDPSDHYGNFKRMIAMEFDWP